MSSGLFSREGLVREADSISKPGNSLLEKCVHAADFRQGRYMNFATLPCVTDSGVSQPQKDAVGEYIGHHRKWSFEQEFMTLPRKSGATCDERYVFGEAYVVAAGLEFTHHALPRLRRWA